MTKVLFHPEAELELDQSIQYYEACRDGLGIDFKNEVSKAISNIIETPFVWPKHKYGTRKFLLRRFPFHIFYLPLPDVLWIVAIAHCKRKPDYWKKRLRESH